MSNPMRNPPPQQPLAHPLPHGTRVRYIGADASVGDSGGVGATIHIREGTSGAPGPNGPVYRYAIFVDGETETRQVDQSEIAPAE